MGSSSKGAGQSRPLTEEERRLLSQQETYLRQMGDVAEEQFGLSAEDRDHYISVFREGTDTEARQAIAEMRSRISGTEIDPSTIEGVSIDSLLRDTILSATPEFQDLAQRAVAISDDLTQKYGSDISGLSDTFSTALQDYTTSYEAELSDIRASLGTADQDILSRETGAATAGISTAFREAQREMQSTLAQRGLSGSGVEAAATSDLLTQEALAKAGAIGQARYSAIAQSDARRQQQLGISGMQFQAGAGAAQQLYNVGAQATQGIYGAQLANVQQGMQTTNAATLQGIAGLTQAAQAGQGIYGGAQNYLAGAGATYGQGAQIAGSTATAIGQQQTQYGLGMYQGAQEARGAMIGGAMGAIATGIGAYQASDQRLKRNIQEAGEDNGYTIYTWDWIEEAKELGLGTYNRGVIAQDILETDPHAVFMGDHGYLMVDYAALGLEKYVEGS